MKITKSAPIFGTRSHRYSSFNYEWQGKKNPHAGQGTGKEIKLSYLSNKPGTDGYKRRFAVLFKSLVNPAHGIILLLVNNFSVDLSRFHIGVTKQLRYCIKVCAECQQHGGEGMP